MNKNLLKLLVGFILAVVPVRSYATEGLIPFGGIIDYVIPCTCAMAAGLEQTLVFMQTANPPYVGSYLYTFGYAPIGTTLYREFLAIIPSTYLLGEAAPGTVPCMVYAGTSCVPAGYGLPMVHVGTSL